MATNLVATILFFTQIIVRIYPNYTITENITVDSPEVELLKQKADKIDELEKLVKSIMMKNGGTQEQ